jgi:DNA mismatch repair protein MutL
MGQIRVLPDQLVNQIAAGEVIERPASIVKELLENAIDAKATHITVEISKGGTEKIVITDDGVGMDEMDARLAFERHATSKIRNLDDLSKLGTLGFRGEALASIASVSNVTLQTKREDALGGIRLEMEGGKDPVVTAAGCPVGTKMEISNLFFNTPARKKYLKSEQTEYRHILDAVQDAALSHPEIAFKFVSNNRTVFDLLKTSKMEARIGALFGKAVSSEMIEVFYGGSDLQISGHVGKPQTARSTRKYQYFIINGRPVQDHRLSYAVKEGFSNLIPSTQHPVFVISIKIDPSRVDVNVHPRKLEVRFASPQEIFRVVKSAVHGALHKEHLMHNVPLRESNLDMPAYMRKKNIKAVSAERPKVEEEGADYDETMAPTLSLGGQFTPGTRTAASYTMGTSSPPAGAPTSPIFGETSAPASGDIAARKAYLLQKRQERLAARGITEEPSTPSAPSSGPVSSVFGAPIVSESSTSDAVATFGEEFNEARVQGRIRPIAQVKNSYIIAQDDDGIVVIDQHAAHERVMLGKFRANEAEREPTKQSLLTPIQLELNYREKAVLEENLELLGSLGFEISEFGGSTYNIDTVPDFLVNEDVGEVMQGFIDDLLNEQAPREAARRHDHILDTLACRAAIKFNRRLSSYEQESLIKSLMETEGSSACAHGRPTMIRMTYSELERKFGRT